LNVDVITPRALYLMYTDQSVCSCVAMMTVDYGEKGYGISNTLPPIIQQLHTRVLTWVLWHITAHLVEPLTISTAHSCYF
jgi:hypothetical protein